jgi:hypothetical protein
VVLNLKLYEGQKTFFGLAEQTKMSSPDSNEPQDAQRTQQIPRSAVNDLPSADNPLWWPKTAASSFQPRPFGGTSLPKASRLPKAGSAVVTDTGRLYNFSTLTSNVAAVRSIIIPRHISVASWSPSSATIILYQKQF